MSLLSTYMKLTIQALLINTKNFYPLWLQEIEEKFAYLGIDPFGQQVHMLFWADNGSKEILYIVNRLVLMYSYKCILYRLSKTLCISNQSFC